MMRMMVNTLPSVHHHAHALLPPHPRCSLALKTSSSVAFDGLFESSSSSIPRSGRPSMKWDSAGTNRGKLLTCFAIEESTQKPDFVSEKSIWPCLLPRPFIYSSSFLDVDPVQLSELWATTLNVRRDPKKILKALRYSFAFVVVLADVDEASSSGVVRRLKTVGVGRAISDGTFIASICDVAVDPAYQRRGIGRRIVKKLVENMKNTGGPSGYAVFAPPIARRFFWMIGFRSDKKYRLMAYRGEGDERDVKLFDREKLQDKELFVRRPE